MHSKTGQWLSRLTRRPSLAGRGLPERMRSTTFALLGITAAAGLGLVAIFSQQGWPLLAPSLIQGPPAGHEALAPARTLTGQPDARASAGVPQSVPDASTAAGAARTRGGFSVDVGRQLPVRQGSSGGLGGNQPGESPEPQPASPPEQPPVVTPEPATAQTAPVTPTGPGASTPPTKASTASTGSSGETESHHGYGRSGSRGYGHHYVPPAPPSGSPQAPEPEPESVEPSSTEEPSSYHGYGSDHGYGHSSWHHDD